MNHLPSPPKTQGGTSGHGLPWFRKVGWAGSRGFWEFHGGQVSPLGWV